MEVFVYDMEPFWFVDIAKNIRRSSMEVFVYNMEPFLKCIEIAKHQKSNLKICLILKANVDEKHFPYDFQMKPTEDSESSNHIIRYNVFEAWSLKVKSMTRFL